MSMLADYLSAFTKNYQNPAPAAPEIWEIIQGTKPGPTPSHAWESEAQQAAGVEQTRRVAGIAAEWKDGHPFSGEKAPRPAPKLRPQPRF